MRITLLLTVWLSAGLVPWLSSAAAADSPGALCSDLDVERGIVAVLGISAGEVDGVLDCLEKHELTVYVQTADPEAVRELRERGAARGDLGQRLFVDSSPLKSIHLAANVADALVVPSAAADGVAESEVLRVLRPRATARLGSQEIVKPVPDGVDSWSHPYHGPDNNPQSQDQLVRGNFRTQFLAYPKFSPMPEQTVAAGGRLFKAMGHIAHKANQNEWLNTLLCINAYNGTILWKRQLSPGFMLHRNTMIATDEALLMGDHESCKVYDARTGEILEEITVPEAITDGPVWKWMALKQGVLYALVGNPEIQVDTQRSTRTGLGHWPWGMWKGHDYNDPRTAFGHGRTFVAIDLKTKELLWHYRDEEFLDARGVCMTDNRIFFCSPERFLACLDATTGKLKYKNSDADLLESIGPNGKAQHYITGYATTSYIKCNSDYVFFAGPQRSRMVVASAEDGQLAWTYPVGNLQLVLRTDAIYASGPQQTTGVKLAYGSGSMIDEFPARRACTRATGCVDSIFYRATGGTVRVMTDTNTATHIAPMRPPCQDGVLISDGHLYWGPWMCGCQLSLYGHIGLGPADEQAERTSESRNALQIAASPARIQPLPVHAEDWSTYRGDNARTGVTELSVADDVELEWSVDVTSQQLPTAPVVAGGRVFIADRAGVVQAFDPRGQQVWKAHTGGAVYFPPTVAHDRLYVGSADGRVYTFEAATGRLLWSYRVGPAEWRIPVYERLISRWPVSGGVVVDGDTVYAAAGITHYDGTYLVALDALTGELKASNTASGVISEQVQSGISLQGDLFIEEGELRFLGGGVYETARYELETLRCLNEPKVQVTSQFRTAFYPYYPDYGKYLSLEHTRADGSTLCHDASYEGSVFSNLALEAPLPAGVSRPAKEAARWQRLGRNAPQPEKKWQDQADRRFTSFVVSEERLVAAGHPAGAPETAFLAAVDIESGADVWYRTVPALVVKGGTAVDHTGRIYVTLENGQLLCYRPRS